VNFIDLHELLRVIPCLDRNVKVAITEVKTLEELGGINSLHFQIFFDFLHI
jgi:hypothetical protein